MDARIIVELEHNLDNWDELLESAGFEAGLHQTTFWADVKSQSDHSQPIYLRARCGDKVVASLLLFRTFSIKKPGSIRSYIKTIIEDGSIHGRLEWLYGPVIYNKNYAYDALGALLLWIDKYTKKKHIKLTKGGSFSRTSCFRNDKQACSIYQKHGYIPNIWANILFDLSPSEENLWINLRKNRRRDISLAKRMGAQFIEITTWDEFYKHFYLPYKETENYYNRKYDMVDAWKYQIAKDKKNYYNFYIVIDEAKNTLATMATYTFNKVSSEMAVCITPRAKERKIPAQDLIQWNTIIEAKRRGSVIFDFAGICPNPTTPKEKGIHQFKKKWGGAYDEYMIFHRKRPGVLTLISLLNKKFKSN